jgi:hypothetical protein
MPGTKSKRRRGVPDISIAPIFPARWGPVKWDK